MKAALIVAASWMLSCAVLQGAEREFSDIVRAISDELHARPLGIPFSGLVNFATSMAQPAGVKHIDLAVFENLDLDANAVGDIGKTVRRSAKGSWKPVVEVRSGAETVMVYLHEDSSDCRLLVTVIEAGEVTLAEVKLNPASLEVWLNGDRGVRSWRPKLSDDQESR